MIHALDLQFLGLVPDDLSSSAIRKAWLRAALRTHPDKGAADGVGFRLAKDIYDDVSLGWKRFQELHAFVFHCDYFHQCHTGASGRSDSSVVLSDVVVDSIYLSRFCETNVDNLCEPPLPV